MGARALTCPHGLHICPRCREGAAWPSQTEVLDHEGDVLEAASSLRDVVRAGGPLELPAPVMSALMALCDRVDELDELFGGVADASP